MIPAGPGLLKTPLPWVLSKLRRQAESTLKSLGGFSPT
jgi:hypothetical protein